MPHSGTVKRYIYIHQRLFNVLGRGFYFLFYLWHLCLNLLSHDTNIRKEVRPHVIFKTCNLGRVYRFQLSNVCPICFNCIYDFTELFCGICCSCEYILIFIGHFLINTIQFNAVLICYKLSCCNLTHGIPVFSKVLLHNIRYFYLAKALEILIKIIIDTYTLFYDIGIILNDFSQMIKSIQELRVVFSALYLIKTHLEDRTCQVLNLALCILGFYVISVNQTCRQILTQLLTRRYHVLISRQFFQTIF